MNQWSFPVLIAACLMFSLAAPNVAAEPAENQTRPFHMGFTSWPYGASDEAKQDTYAKVAQHGDLIAFHLDNGVPWVEALAGEKYHPNFEKEIKAMLEAVPEGKAVYLGFAPLNNNRDGLALYRGEAGQMPLPAPWDSLTFADPRIAEAYGAYCCEMIRRFKPVYVNFGIEVLGGLATKKPEQWDDFAGFVERVYKRVKAEHPSVLAGISMGLSAPGSEEFETVKKAFEDISDFVDYAGISTYPYSGPPWGPGDGNPAHLDGDWLSQIRDIVGDKPVAVAETGFIAETIDVPMLDWHIEGKEAWQADYVERLLSEARRLDALFVVWWAVADFDKLYTTFTGWAADVALIWRDTGLYDGELKAREGLHVWDRWLHYARR